MSLNHRRNIGFNCQIMLATRMETWSKSSLHFLSSINLQYRKAVVMFGLCCSKPLCFVIEMLSYQNRPFSITGKNVRFYNWPVIEKCIIHTVLITRVLITGDFVWLSKHKCSFCVTGHFCPFIKKASYNNRAFCSAM